MKKFDFIFAVLQVPLDIVAIFGAFLLSYFLRARVEIPQITVYMWPFDQYAKFVLILIPIWVAIFALEGLYNIKNPKKGIRLISSVFLGVSAGISIMVFWIFFSRFLFFSRLIVVYAFVLTFLFILLARLLLYLLQRFLYSRGLGLKRVIVIGDGEQGKNIAEIIFEKPALGLKLVKLVNSEGIDKLSSILNRRQFEEIILADPNLPEKQAMKVLDFCEEKKIDFAMAPNIFRAKTTNVQMGTIATHPLLGFIQTPLEGWGKVAKRFFDILVSFFGLVLFSPLFIIIPLLVKIDSKGPIFFRHKRIGCEGKSFNVLKFRSMVDNADALYNKLAKKQKSSVFRKKIVNDPRITNLGRFTRATCFDELPQLFNILKGQMSLVGPRPLTPMEHQQVSNSNKKYCRTSYIKPGITGLWQISGRVELSDAERLSLDIYYVENWSLMLDLWIIFKTPLAILKNRGIY